jgi:hypothetical protein
VSLVHAQEFRVSPRVLVIAWFGFALLMTLAVWAEATGIAT